MAVDEDRDRTTDRVTFLLTDVEGSTRRWEADPDRMAALLEAHDAAVEAGVTEAGGQLIKARGEGDSTFAVFPDPGAALDAALACQARLIGEIGLPVRMAIHTGDTDQRWGEYYGPSANRAARLRGLAAGGRVLMSAITADSVRGHLPPGCQLVDLGMFSLRGLERPERVFGLRHPSLPEVLMPRDSLLGEALVGRQRELTLLRGLLAEAESSSMRIAVVVGDGGIGKTRLAEVLGREACSAGGRLVWATAHSDTGAPPFSAWTALLDRLSNPGSEEHPADHPGDSQPGQPAPSGSLDPDRRVEPDRDTLYHQIIAGLRQAAQVHPVLVVLDDLHLADPSSLQLLRRLATERDLERVMFVAMSRPTPADHPARRVLSYLSRASHAATIELSELPDEESAHLLAGFVPDLDPDAATAVIRHAGGNPLFLRAYATAIAERATQPTSSARRGTMAMPESVRVAIGERLRAFDADTVRVLEVAAVGGRAIAPDITAAAAGVDDAIVLRALGAGETSGLVCQAAVTVQAWRFTHDLIRDAIVAGLDPAQRSVVHGKIGRAIEKLRAADPAGHAAEIATHLSQAPPEHWPSAVSYGELAGRTALRAGAFEEAAGHCRRALIQVAVGGGHAAERARLLLMLGSALTADDIEGAGDAILEAIGIARGIGDQELLIKAIEALPHDMGLLDARAVAELQAAVNQIGEGQPTLTARLQGHLAFHHYTARHWDEQERAAEEAWRLSRQVDDPATRFVASLGRLLTRWCDPDRAGSRLALDECIWTAETCRDPSITLRGRYMRMRPLIELADRDGFNTTLRLLEEGVGGHVATYSRWVATTWRTLEATLDGEFERAGALLGESARLGQGAAGPISLAVQFHQRSILRHEESRLAEEIDSLEMFERAWPRHPVVLGWLALALATAGETARALAVLTGVDEDGFAEIPAQLCFALAPLTEAAVALGDVSMVTRLAEALSSRAGYLFVGFGIASTCYGAVDRYLGLAHASTGDFEAALASHARAARLHRRFRCRLWVLHGQLDTAAALAGRGGTEDVARARSLADEVIEASMPSQMTRVRDRAADLRRILA
jgi:class 3 adenylate cyclase